MQSLQRSGYVLSIVRALGLVRTPFLFWLEDDWSFNQPVNLPPLIEALATHDTWTQIRLNKTAPIAPSEREAPLDTAAGLFRSQHGFSANPHLGRTSHLLAGFKAFIESPKTAANTFEPFLTTWFESHGHICAIQDPGEKPAVAHAGYLESTGRQWHATISLSEKPAPYSSGLRQDGRRPALWRRIVLAGRLISAAVRVGLRALYKYNAYDLGFRFIDLSRRKDE
ncbi:MAG: hypothetical protein QM715_02035 [Nibricoccus sp.]